MSRDQAWAHAENARLLAEAAKEVCLSGSSNRFMQKRSREDEQAALQFAVLEHLATAIKELCIPEGPIRLQDLKLTRGRWWE